MANEFQTFAGDPAANVMPLNDYTAPAFTTRLVGFVAGTALSAELNRVWRQSSLISSMIGQFVFDTTALNMLDDGTPAGMAALQFNFTEAIRTIVGSMVNTGAFLPLVGGTLSGPLTIQASPLRIEAPAGQWATQVMTRTPGMGAQLLVGNPGDIWRWDMVIATNEPETGGNAGSNFAISRFNDAGGYLGTPIQINRATGVVTFEQPPLYAGGPLPYLPLSGGVVNGPVGIIGNGIAYHSFGGNYHAFNWDGQAGAVNAYVDGTWVGTIAMRGWSEGRLGAYLPLAGGTITGNLGVNGMHWGTQAGFSSTVYFGNAGDFNNYSYVSNGVQYRVRQWAGNWSDVWDTSNGNRWWGTYNGRAMGLTGNADLWVSGTLNAYGARLLSVGAGVAPTVVAWYQDGGNAKGFYVDGSAMYFGHFNGDGSLASPQAYLHNNGTFHCYGAINSDSSFWTNGTVSANGQIWSGTGVSTAGQLQSAGWSVSSTGFYTNGPGGVVSDVNVRAGGEVSANGNIVSDNGHVYAANAQNGAILTTIGVIYRRLAGQQIAFRWDGRAFFAWIDGGEKALITGNNDRRVNDMRMEDRWLAWTDSDGSTWYADTFRSDARFKENIAPAGPIDSLALVGATSLWAYNWIGYDLPRTELGFVAEELEKTLPDAVVHTKATEDSEPVAHLDPAALIAHLFRAIQQLVERVTALEASHA
jgi:hypothetical protein